MHEDCACTTLPLARAAATPTPTPSQVDPNLVTPGPWGFVVIALVAVAAILLIWDMMRRIRRGRVRADIREELDAEEQAAAADRGDGCRRPGDRRRRRQRRPRAEALIPASVPRRISRDRRGSSR